MKRGTLVWILALALLVRFEVGRELGGTALRDVLLGDARAFVAWGHELAAGDWLGDEVFYQAPLYPYFLGAIERLGGDLAVVRALQAVMGAGACVLIACAARRVFDARTGVVAGLIAALYAPSVWLEGMIQKTALATFLTACFAALLAREVFRERGDDAPRSGARGALPALALGVLLGLLTLVRENALVLGLPALAWYLATRGARRHALPLVAGTLLILTPVGLRNAALGGAFLPTASNAGVNFYIGNGEGALGLYRPLVAGQGSAAYERDDATRLAERAAGRALTPAGVSAYWLGRAGDDLRADPARFGALLIGKTQFLIHRTEWMDTESFESHRGASPLLAILAFAFHFGFLFPLAVLGLGHAWFQERRGWPLGACALALGASIVLFFVTARFRAGLVPFLLPFAACGALELFLGLRHRWRRRRARWLLCAAACAAALANLPLDRAPLSLWTPTVGGDRIAVTESNLSSAYLARGDARRAYLHAAYAIARTPDDANALYNLGQAAAALERYEQAIAAFSKAWRVEPSYEADCLDRIGSIRATLGDLPGAVALLERATQADPTHARAFYDLGLALRRSNRPADARRAYETALELDPRLVDAHHNLGFLDEREGRWSSAIARYEEALAVDPTFAPSLFRLATLLATHPDANLRDGARALTLARRCRDLEDAIDWELEDLLAAALAETGDFENAERAERRALELAPGAPDATVRARLEARARAYARHEAKRLDVGATSGE